MTTTSEPGRRRRRTRRGRGEGSIYLRSDGVWCSPLSMGYDEAGKRRRRTVTGKTKEDVKKQLATLQGQLAHGTLRTATRITVAELLTRWLEDDVRVNRRAATYASYATNVELHIKPTIGHHRVEMLTATHVQYMLSEMERKGRSPRLRQLVYANLHRALNQAIKLGTVQHNACRGVTRPRVQRQGRRVLDRAQVQQLLTAVAHDRLGALYTCAIATGMRQGELLAVRWEDLDIERAAISVSRSLSEVNGKLTVNEPKTAAGRRRIPLPATAVAALRIHRKRMLAEGNYAPDRPIFCDSEGGWIRKQNLIRRSFKPLLLRAKLPAIRFHDLRHTSATLLLEANENPKVVQERLGHSTVAITLDIYSHVAPSMQEAAAAKLETLMTRPVQEPCENAS